MVVQWAWQPFSNLSLSTATCATGFVTALMLSAISISSASSIRFMDPSDSFLSFRIGSRIMGAMRCSLSSILARCFTAFKMAAEGASIISVILPVTMVPSCISIAKTEQMSLQSPEAFKLSAFAFAGLTTFRSEGSSPSSSIISLDL